MIGGRTSAAVGRMTDLLGFDRRAAAAVVAAMLVAAIVFVVGVVSMGRPPEADAVRPPEIWRPDHTVVVIFENKERKSVIGHRSAPYLTELAARGANLTHSYGIDHPSQPNYVALFYGSQHGVQSNRCVDLDEDNLGRQLLDAGLTFTGYSEGLPRPGFRGCERGRYQRKHNPWASARNLPAQVNQPFTAFPTDFAQLPSVAFVVPDMCHSMHDCTVGTGDRWVRRHLEAYARWAVSHNSLLVVTFDENSGGTVNSIPTLLVGARVRPGVNGEKLTHYGLLRTLEDAYGLEALGHAATARPLRTIWSDGAKAVPPPPKASPSSSVRASSAASATPSRTGSPRPLRTPSRTASPTNLRTPSPTASPTNSRTPSPTATRTPDPTPRRPPSPTPTSTPWPVRTSSSTPPSGDRHPVLSNGDFEGGLTGWRVTGYAGTWATEAGGPPGRVSVRAGGLPTVPGESILSQTFVPAPGQTRLSVSWRAECTDRRRSWSMVALRDVTAGRAIPVADRSCRQDRHWREVTTTVEEGHHYTLYLVNHDDVLAARPTVTWFDRVRLSG